MAPLHLMLLVLAVLQYTSADCITNGTELLFTLIINRHGDRAPEKDILELVSKSVDMDLIEKKVSKYGYEQLTEKGKNRAYELGKSLRSRYGGLLSQTYNPSEIYVRAANNTRTKETLRLSMAGLYPTQSAVFNNTVIRQPVPNFIINDTSSYLNFYEECAPFNEYLIKASQTSCPSISTQYPTLLKKLSNITGIDVTSKSLLVYEIHDAYQSLQNVGYKLNSEIEALLPEMEIASGDAVDVLLGQNKYLPIEAGMLLNDFFATVTKIYEGTTTEKMRLYSAHDLNVYAMQLVSQATPPQGVPFYCSFFAVELRRYIKTGELVVLPVYLPKPGDPVVYLRVRGCGGYLCGYDTFKGITNGSSITLEEYDSRCQINTANSR